jgi:hypothetical protein
LLEKTPTAHIRAYFLFRVAFILGADLGELSMLMTKLNLCSAALLTKPLCCKLNLLFRVAIILGADLGELSMLLTKLSHCTAALLTQPLCCVAFILGKHSMLLTQLNLCTVALQLNLYAASLHPRRALYAAN